MSEPAEMGPPTGRRCDNVESVFTVELDTSCSCCGEADPDVRVFATEELARAYAAVDGGKVLTHDIENALPSLYQWVRLRVLFTDGVPGQVTESFTPTYEVPNCTGAWAPREDGSSYEKDGDAWRGVYASSEQYTSVEIWAPDTPAAREWHAAKVAEVTAASGRRPSDGE